MTSYFKTQGFDMNLESKLVVIQILDLFMRLTSIRWHGRAWNKYLSFTDFCEKRGFKNVGHMIHANRFGEFEERCCGGVYLADLWSEWLETYTSVRNQIACYLRTVIGLLDFCKFQWSAAALIGFHVTVPFLSMLMDHKVTTRKLLTILPNLYHNLCNYPCSLIEFDKPACHTCSC